MLPTGRTLERFISDIKNRQQGPAFLKVIYIRYGRTNNSYRPCNAIRANAVNYSSALTDRRENTRDENPRRRAAIRQGDKPLLLDEIRIKTQRLVRRNGAATKPREITQAATLSEVGMAAPSSDDDVSEPRFPPESRLVRL